jgi:hypothetical protein
LHHERQTTLTNGRRMIWLFTPEDSAPRDFSQACAFEAFGCEAAAELQAADPDGRWFEFSDEHETKHTHLRWIAEPEVFASVLTVLAMSEDGDRLPGTEPLDVAELKRRELAKHYPQKTRSGYTKPRIHARDKAKAKASRAARKRNRK